MNKLFLPLFFILWFGISVKAQNAEDILKKYYAAIDGIENISYKTHNIDTFADGTVWNKTGYCILKKGKSKSLSGFLFKGKRNDMDQINIFDGSKYYEIDTKQKTYTTDTIQISSRTLIGSPGGQMILQEMVLKIERYNRLSYSETDSSYILRFEWPPNQQFQIENRFKELHLDKGTYLPFYRYHYLEAFGEKQVNIARLTDMVINSPDLEDTFPSTEFLNDYVYKKPNHRHAENNIHKLINNPAPDFELQDLNNITSQLSGNKGKVILLDFWEIWCSPCIGSIQRLKELVKKYPADQFEIWSIVSDSSTFSKVKSVAERKEINYRIFFGNKGLAKQYLLSGVPLYVLIDPDGIVKHAQFGYTSKLEEELEKLIR
jgi:peroxiredoxin